MGTNYYASTKPCPHCGNVKDTLHIGKSAFGWRFALAHNSENNLCSPETWLDYITTHDLSITDEYGDQLTVAELRDVITERSNYVAQSYWPVSLYHDDPPPLDDLGLLKHVVDGSFCSANGDRSWDLIEREFS